MKVEGIWKPVGRLASYNKDLPIKDGIMEIPVIGRENRKEEYVLTECTVYRSLVEEAVYISAVDHPEKEDMIIHVEEYDGHLISILSFTTMEYDGRGLIVMSEYVHEDDYQYVPADFSSKIYHYRNDREAAPMMMRDTGAPSGVGMMGMDLMSMMNMMNMQRAGRASGVTAADTSENADTSGENEWTCSCGQTNNHGKFCPMCGMPRP